MKKGLQLVLNQLARREHSVLELTRKLSTNGYSLSEINETLAYCHTHGLQSDRRFAEQFCRVHVERGDGPIKIKHLLRHYGIESILIQDVLNEATSDWALCAKNVLEKQQWRFSSQDKIFRQ